YLGAATKMIVPGAAASSGAGEAISISPLPHSVKPSRDASSPSFIAQHPSQSFPLSGEDFAGLERIRDLLGRDVAQAVVMSEAAGPFQAGTAFQRAIDDAALRTQRARARWIGRAEDG